VRLFPAPSRTLFLSQESNLHAFLVRVSDQCVNCSGSVINVVCFMSFFF